MLKLATASSLAMAFALFAAGAADARIVTIPFSASNFSDPLNIDNSYFPLVAGRRTRPGRTRATAAKPIFRR